MSEPTPFKISIPDADLTILSQKLKLARLPDEPAGYDIGQGVRVADMQRLVQYWQSTYLPNWRAHEAKLNELPMFTMPVRTEKFGELDVHFVHAQSDVKGAIPLLFVHGWPGSFIEVIKMLPLLTKAGDGDKEGPAFHVVAPSLPNYGFSEGVSKRGFHLAHYTEICHNLMLSLGYTTYVAQGGDWGSFIARLLARNYPTHVRAVHVNMAFFNIATIWQYPLTILRALVTWPWWPKHVWQGLQNAQNYMKDGNGYFRIQATRPQTVAYCLSDSPVALLGWIHEKLIQWTDSYPWTDDEILTWVSIYWFSRAGPGASVRTYFEVEHAKDPGYNFYKDMWGYLPRSVKLGITQFPSDLIGMPGLFAKTLGNAVFESWGESGGHFAAYERPEILARELKKMFGRGGGAYGAVEGADGYGEGKKRV